jgi:hypothetical protein
VKNWRYGSSGFAFVANTRLEANATPLDADLTSRLTAIGVDGLDVAASDVPRPAALGWLYRRLGIDIGEATLGVPQDWRSVAPLPPVAEFRFVDDFKDNAGGWVGGVHVTRLEKRHDVLVVEAEGASGTIRRDVEWDLRPVGEAMLVMDLAGRDIQRVRIEVEGQRGNVARDAAIPAEPSRFAVVELAMPADRYHAVTVRLEPTPGLSHFQRTTGLSVIRAGRLLLRSFSVYAATTEKEET